MRFKAFYGRVRKNKLTKNLIIYEKESGLQNVRILREMHTSLYEEFGRNRLKEIDEALASGKITLDRYEAQKADIQKLIIEYQEKLEDKSNKLHAKEQELEQITKDAAKARSVIQPFRNLISRHRKLQRKYHCSVRTNGLSVRIGLSPSSLPRLSAR